MFDEQKIADLAKLTVSAMELIPATWEAMITADAPRAPEWEAIGPILSSLADDDLIRNDKELQPMLRLGDLARIMLAHHVEELESVYIPEKEGTGYEANILALCRCVRAKRLAAVDTANEARHLANFAHNLQQGFRYYASDKQSAERAIVAIANAYRRSTELSLGAGHFNEAVTACANFIAMSNVLSRQYGRPDEAGRAIDVCIRVVEALPLDSDAGAMPVAALCNNAITSCKWLYARTSNADEQRPPVRQGLKLADRMRSSLSVAPEDGEESTSLQIREACLRHLAELHLEAAHCGVDAPGRHVATARGFLRELQDFAEKHTDQDLQLRVKQTARRFEDRLREISLPSADEGSATDPEVEITKEWIRDAFDTRFLGFENAVERIRSATAPEAAKRALEECLDRWAEEMGDPLSRVVAEVGLNHHVCRILLALGAVASCRLGSLAHSSLEHWLVEAAADEALTGAGYRGSRQRAWAVDARESELEVLIGLKKLAVFTEIVGQTAELRPILQEKLRMTLRCILRETLRAAAPYVRMFDTPQSSPTADVSLVSKLLPPWSVGALLSGYGLTESAPMEAPAGMRVRREIKTSPGPKRDTAAMIQKMLEQDPEQALSEIPRIDTQWDEEPEGAGLTGGDGTLVGRTLIMDGRKKRIEQLLGEGREKIVYGVVDVETGERTALAIFKESESEAQRLVSRLGELVKNLDTNQDEILRISDRVLQLDPNNESVLFNKGIVLLSRHEDSAALECFRRALKVSPKDLLNWLHAGVASSRVGLHEESSECLYRAVELDVNETAQYLYSLPWMAEELSESARAVADGDPTREDVRAILNLLAVVEQARNSPSTEPESK